MDASIINLKDLFKDKDISYRIPQFQRPYTWKSEQIEPLWEDVRHAANTLIAERAGDAPEPARPHFMGAIVLQKQSAKIRDVQRLMVIDGQQRLTTLQLLIRAIQSVFIAHNEGDRAQHMMEFTLNAEKYQITDEELKIRQANQLDSIAFKSVVLNDDPTTSHLVQRGYAYFKKQVQEWLDSTDNFTAYADALEEIITERLKFAVIELDEDERPHNIFEMLNARGEPLTQSDLVKNIVMYNAGVVDSPRRASELWGMFDTDPWWRTSSGESRTKRSQLDRLLHYYLQITIQRTVREDRVAVEFRNYANGVDIDAIMAQLRKAAVIYKEIVDGRMDRYPREVRNLTTNFKAVNHYVAIMPSMWMLTQNLPQDVLKRVARAIDSYIMRRVCLGLVAYNFNSTFIHIIRQVSTNPPDLIADSVIKELNGFGTNGTIWPDDLMLRQRLIQEKFPPGQKNAKTVLVAIESAIRPRQSELIDMTQSFTLEHVMPKSWQGNWKLKSNSEDMKLRRETAIQSLGNLTLLTDALNSSASNAPWHSKREKLQSYSKLSLTRDILEVTEDGKPWDEDAIEERAERLVGHIVHIWPHVDELRNNG